MMPSLYPCSRSSACRSSVAGASRSTGNATSSMITVVPVRRTAPTDGNMPLRTSQRRAHSSGSVENASGAAVRIPARIASIAATRVASAAPSAARVSMRSAAPSAGRPRIPAGMPGLRSTERERRPVHQLDRVDRGALERSHRLARGSQVVEQDERARLVGVVGNRPIGDRRDEAERPLGADHEVSEDVDRIREVDQRVDAVAGRVLHAVLVPDALCERRIGAHAAGERLQAGEKPGVARAERGDACGLRGVEHRAVGQHHADRGERVIAVLRRAAAHAARVVGGDSADLRGVDRRRIGPDLAAVRGEVAVGVGADDPGLQPDRLRARAERPAPPAVAEQREDRVADRLAGKAGAGGAERHRRAVRTARGEQADDVGLALDDRDDLRHEAVEARIGAVGEGAQRVGDEPLARHEAREVVVQPIVGRAEHRPAGSAADQLNL